MPYAIPLGTCLALIYLRNYPSPSSQRSTVLPFTWDVRSQRVVMFLYTRGYNMDLNFFSEVLLTESAVEGAKAFFEKRMLVFEGQQKGGKRASGK